MNTTDTAAPSDEQIVESGYMHTVEDDEPLFAFDRKELIAMVRELIALATTPQTDGAKIIAQADSDSCANGYGVEDGTGVAHGFWWTFDREGLLNFARALAATHAPAMAETGSQPDIYVWFAEATPVYGSDGEQFMRAWTKDSARVDGLCREIGREPIRYRAAASGGEQETGK